MLKIKALYRKQFSDAGVTEQRYIESTERVSSDDTSIFQSIEQKLNSLIEEYSSYQEVVNECSGEGYLHNKKQVTYEKGIPITIDFYPIRDNWNIYISVESEV